MKYLIAACVLLISQPSFALLELSASFSSHMVIQRNQPIRVTGKASPNQTVTLYFSNQRVSALAGKDSCFTITLAPERASTKPQQLELFAGKERLVLEDLLIGDVWICTGQSNMEWPFSKDEFFKEEIAFSNQPLLRIYNTDFAGKYLYGVAFKDSILENLEPQRFYKGEWQVCNQQTAAPMSAIGYYFAKKLVQETGIPIGMINLSIGGAPIETFIDPKMLRQHPQFKRKMQGNWLANNALPSWIRERAIQQLASLPAEQLNNGEGPNHAFKPGFAFEAAIPKLSKLPVSGILFYQGESNALEEERVHEYGALLQLLVKSYRQQWNNMTLPFYWVQLSSIDTPHYASNYWPAFRNNQREQLDSISNSGMAQSSDIGNAKDVHPKNKRTVAHRLANWALVNQYGKKGLVVAGPMIEAVRIKNNKLELEFKYATHKLLTSNGKPLEGFSFDGKTPVKATISGNRVIIPYDSTPETVYYGWAPYSNGNLINDAGLPASTFSKKITIEQQNYPSLIPLPQSLTWKQETLLIKEIQSINFSDSGLHSMALQLQKKLKEKGAVGMFSRENTSKKPGIQLVIDSKRSVPASSEAYTLSVSKSGVVITAASDTGIYMGIQTLYQLMNNPFQLQGCEIADQPAFNWRGYMVDVGRNYQSIDLLKAQIDRMATYKLNTFHFHVTEDIAWRLEVPNYPALTADSTMLRDAGMYYTKAEVLDLMDYCRERYIRFILEIDMPGHSAAFEKAMGVPMQDPRGLILVEDIIRKVAATYPINYLHIGGDEVKISNKSFLPEMVQLLDSLGLQSIGWSPGGNIPGSTIRQLWMADAPIQPEYRYIDSRHLYLNHMDPLEAVATIFHRQIGDRRTSDTTMLGGIICVWNDRRLINENYHLLLNGVYPALLAFAERSWRGGGHQGWTTVLGNPGSLAYKEFTEFENRLLKHRSAYFSHQPFPYVKQSDQHWKLYGPYQNKGNLKQSFEPENPDFFSNSPTATQTAVGATIVLRHWWAPAVKGHLNKPAENTTWYAHTRIFADTAGEKDCWIGFSNYSRSMVTNAPAEGNWDDRGSRIFVNGIAIDPPVWRRTGKTISLETPLTDEDYYYKKPSKIYFQKGWNDVLIKLPVASFKGANWQNPVKWMFSFSVVDHPENYN